MIDITEIHAKYNETQSLERTVKWLADEHGYNITRQRLSRMFKENGLYVSPPNGWPDLFWEDTTSHLDKVGRFAAEMIRLAYDDLRNDADLTDMNFMSAAYFVSSEFYEVLLQVVMRNVKYTSVDQSLLPEGIDIDKVIQAREIYERNRAYWLP